MLSIIIISKNEERHLPKLLESIKKQKYKDYEVILSDAGSKDNSVKIAKNYGCDIVKGGLPSIGRNNGAKAARGDILLFLDADVVLCKNYLYDAIKEFKNKNLGIAISQIIPLSDLLIDKFLHSFANSFFKAVENIKPSGAGCCGIMVRNSVHKKIEGFDKSVDFGEDTDYIERAAKISKFNVLRKPKLYGSIRRLEKEGRTKLALKYAKSTLYQFAGKKITAKELGYDFGHNNKRKIKKI